MLEINQHNKEYLNLMQPVEHDLIKRCVHCGSVFITDSECESCGRQFSYEWIGTPLGQNSLYSLRQQYQKQLDYKQKILSFFWQESSALTLAYRRKLLRRFSLLLDYLTNKDYADIDQHNTISLFTIELKDLVEEMMNVGVAYQRVVEILDSCSDRALVKSVYYWLNTVEHQRYRFSILDFLFNYRLFGAIRIGFLLISFLATGVICALAIALY